MCVGACLTIQQVSGTQVNVDAGVEARNEAIESPFLHTLTWETDSSENSTVPLCSDLIQQESCPLTFQPAVEDLCCDKTEQIFRLETKL